MTMQGEELLPMEENSKCFSFTLKDLKILLFLYNASCFFAYWMFFNGDSEAALSFAMLASLMGLFVITMKDVFAMMAKDEKERRMQEVELQHKLKAEYQKVYKLRKKERLVQRAITCQTENKINQISNMDTPSQKNTQSQVTLKTIHFSYLDAF